MEEDSPMLVLNRKSEEQILIGNGICVKVLSVKGNTVRIGIEAPEEVTILRGELAVELGNEIAQMTPSPTEINTNIACEVPSIVEAG